MFNLCSVRKQLVHRVLLGLSPSRLGALFWNPFLSRTAARPLVARISQPHHLSRRVRLTEHDTTDWVAQTARLCSHGSGAGHPRSVGSGPGSSVPGQSCRPGVQPVAFCGSESELVPVTLPLGRTPVRGVRAQLR